MGSSSVAAVARPWISRHRHICSALPTRWPFGKLRAAAGSHTNGTLSLTLTAQTGYGEMMIRFSMQLKCSSRVQTASPCCIADAAIHMSLVGIGLPLARSCLNISA